MNAQPKAVKAKQPKIANVKMSDGRTVAFTGDNHRVSKDILLNGQPIDQQPDDVVKGASLDQLAVRMDFRNGQTRTYPLNSAHAIRFAAAGALTKYGQAFVNQSGDTLDEWPQRADTLHEKLSAGQWGRGAAAPKPVGNVLVAALMEFMGKPRDTVQAFLKELSADQKRAMLTDPRIAEIVSRLEQQRSAAAASVNTDTLFDQLKAI